MRDYKRNCLSVRKLVSTRIDWAIDLRFEIHIWIIILQMVIVRFQIIYTDDIDILQPHNEVYKLR